jgi:choline-glycine betaine transporter
MNTKQRNYGLYAVAAAIFAVGALALGLPVGTLSFLAIVLACPLMMIFMMRGRGMHRGDSGEGHRHDSADGDSAHRSGPRDHTGTP